jgi:hypothetical protein
MQPVFLLSQATPAAPTSSGVAAAGQSNVGHWSLLIDAHLENGTLVVNIGPIALIALLVFFVLWLIWKLWFRDRSFGAFEIVEAELDIAHLGKVRIRPNHESTQIAHSAWVELSTRKAALAFDESHDVVVDVYDSYYQLFGRLRDLTKAVPAYKLRSSPDTRELVNEMVKVLNYGLRPHLTRWQARFRRWYNDALSDPANRNKSPQEIQRGFPEYSALIHDLKTLQDQVVKYSEFLRNVAQGKDR